MSTSASSDRALRPARVAATLAVLLGLQPVTTDLYLPALPALTRDLGAGMSAAQQTIAALLLAFGIAQLFWGPLSDRFGRRPVLLVGLALYVAAGIGSAFAASIEALVGWRVLQGVGLAASVVCARAVLRDCFEPARGARVMAWAMTGLGVLAIASPTSGGWLVAHAGWRAAFGAVAAVGVVGWLWVAFGLPETAPAPGPASAAPRSARALLSSWRRIASHPEFITWAGLAAATYGGLYVVLAGSPFVYIGVLGLSAPQMGMALALNSAAYIAGTFICRHWVARVGTVGAVRRAAAFTLAGGLGMALPVALGVQTLATIVAPQCLYAFGHGVHQPCAQAAVTGPFAREAGTASALAGFVLALTAFGTGLWLGTALDGTARPLVYGVAAWAVVTAAVAWLRVRAPAAARAAA